MTRKESRQEQGAKSAARQPCLHGKQMLCSLL